MTKRTLIILTTTILVLAVGIFAYTTRTNDTKTSQTANAPIASGISLLFNTPLQTELTATLKDSSGTTVKEVPLEQNASRFNIEVPSGVYQVVVSSKDNSLPPFPPETLTVSDGVLSELQLSIPHAEEQ